MAEARDIIYNYLRATKKFPSIWCPGCGIGVFLRALIRAIDRIGYDKDRIVLVSGIGCSGRITTYVDFNTLHTVHGRALTFATGIKLANPELKVIVIMGDGDALSIGGNHFIHAARRNIEITAIIINNGVLAMTGGQLSPTTPQNLKTATSPYGNVENPLDICELAGAAGSIFVARTTVYHVLHMDRLIGEAIGKKGFSVLEVLSPCPTRYGKRAGFDSAVAMLKWQRDNTVSVEKAKRLSEEKLCRKIQIGVLLDREAPSYQERLASLQERVNEGTDAL